MTRGARFLAATLVLCAGMAVAQGLPDAEARRRWAQAHPVLRIAIDPQWGSEVAGGRGRSLVSQYLDLASRRSGVRLETVRTGSWEESVKAFRERRVDVLPSTSDRLLTMDVGKQALLSLPFYVGRTVIVARTVGPSHMDLWTLRGRTLAFKGGGAYESWLRREHPEIRPLPLADIHQVLAAVEAGIADAAVGVDVVYHPIVRRDYAVSLRVVGDVPEMPVTVRVAVHTDQHELADLLDTSLRGVSPDENEAVIERWLQTAYLRAPTLAQVVSAYRVEIGLGAALIVALVFALWQLRRAQLASRRGERQKTMLLAVMSHEVRNAVNAVASSIELMAKQPLEGSQRDLMAIAQVSSRNLQNLLKNALDYTRAEVHGFTPDPVACDVVAVARDVVESQRPAVEAKGLQVRLDLPMGPLPWLLVDETRLRQLLENLFSNAVKFTAQGHVGMAVWQDAERDDGVRRLVFDVFDTGIGIPAGQQKALFRPFSQARGNLDTRLGGTGLGLAICRDIVEHLGGTLELSSTVDVGTSVRVELPTSLVPVHQEAADADAAIEACAHGDVLLVEDHPANRQIIAAQLAFLGYGLRSAERGQAAIEAFAPGRFAAVLLDCELPDMSGYDVAAMLRAREADAGATPTRILAISARQDAAHRRRCEESGMDVVLGKPLSLETLRSALVGSAGAPATPFGVDGEGEAFRDEARRDLEAIARALETRDVERMRRHLHRLLGAALMCDMNAIVAEAECLEDMLADDHPDHAAVRAQLDVIASHL